MKIKVHKLPVFILENKFFDQLSNPNEIAVYAYIERMQGIAYYEKHIMEQFGLSELELDKILIRFCEIGYLTLNSNESSK